MNGYKRHIAFLLFLLFSFTQLVELHALEDSDTPHEHCALCDITSPSELEFTYAPLVFVIENTSTPLIQSTLVVSHTVLRDFRGNFGLCNKAPPVA